MARPASSDTNSFAGAGKELCSCRLGARTGTQPGVWKKANPGQNFICKQYGPGEGNLSKKVKYFLEK